MRTKESHWNRLMLLNVVFQTISQRISKVLVLYGDVPLIKKKQLKVNSMSDDGP
jgi:bifunctional N-acetylglucosamine-1-phosphate-uridyltransferase/glucosamine-1-phosphate-acetyltransferase GlmU-like protein